MGCGCKKKKVNPTTLNQERNKIRIGLSEAKDYPPEVLNPPPPPSPESNVDQIVDKLNDILKPKTL